MLKIQWPDKHLIFDMRIPIPRKNHHYIETGPRSFLKNYFCCLNQIQLFFKLDVCPHAVGTDCRNRGLASVSTRDFLLTYYIEFRLLNDFAEVNLKKFGNNNGKSTVQLGGIIMQSNIAYYNMIWYTALQKLMQNIKQSLCSQKKPHASHSLVSYGVSVVKIWDKTDSVIIPLNCILEEFGISLFFFHPVLLPSKSPSPLSAVLNPSTVNCLIDWKTLMSS